MNKIAVIIPAYNEEFRLDGDYFAKETRVDFLFVNDGSTDNTLKIIEKLSTYPHINYLSLNQNCGKSEAVRTGLIWASKNNYEELAYIDCDLSTEVSEIINFKKYNLTNMNNHADVVIGSRIKKSGSTIKRSRIRHLIGRTIQFIASAAKPNLKVYDSQCGAKLFKNTAAVTDCFTEPFKYNWLFDIELILRLRERNLVILECPLGSWTHKSKSKIKVTDYPKILGEIASLFLKKSNLKR